MYWITQPYTYNHIYRQYLTHQKLDSDSMDFLSPIFLGVSARKTWLGSVVVHPVPGNAFPMENEHLWLCETVAIGGLVPKKKLIAILADNFSPAKLDIMYSYSP